MHLRFASAVLLISAVFACGDDDVTDNQPKPVTALFAEGAGATSATFFDAPYPSDTRLTPQGAPDVSNWPTGNSPSMLETALQGALERQGFPVVPVGYFRFDGDPPARDATELELRGLDGAFALIDVDPTSPDRGATFPVVGTHPEPDAYTPEHLFAVAARPGLVLHPKRTYAFVVFRKLGDEAGVNLQAPGVLRELASGQTPARADGEALRASYAPLWETLQQKNVNVDDVVAATVFTTGDVVEQTAKLGDGVLAKHSAVLSELTLETPPAPEGFPSFCHYTATLTVPQFQQGRPTYNTEGMFTFGEDGVPVVQREEAVNFSLTIPRKPMPEAGYPLVIYFHGSGGVAREFVDGAEKNEPGQLQSWPGRVLADKGFAVAGSSLPIAPDRVRNAQAFDYLNINNPGAMLGTFRQGVLEQRLLIRALGELRLPKELIEACEGASLPEGVTEAKLDLTRLAAQGQSMGGMYTNLISATEPLIHAAVPTGAGGYWMYFFLETTTVRGNGVLQTFLRTGHNFTFMSPVLHLFETALEAVDPMVSMPRLARRPLDGHPVRPIYEPVGLDDSYFPPKVYDAMVLAYGHPRAGDEVWSSMGEAQRLIGLDQAVSYPVKQNLSSQDGSAYTGVAVQYAATGPWDSHSIFRRLEEVRHQFGCFHATFQKNGVAVVPAPGPESEACPE